MNKRLIKKYKNQAEQKIIAGQPLTQMERITFNKSMESWLGPEIIKKIKHLGK
jgi:hypothetical protein